MICPHLKNFKIEYIIIYSYYKMISIPKIVELLIYTYFAFIVLAYKDQGGVEERNWLQYAGHVHVAIQGLVTLFWVMHFYTKWVNKEESKIPPIMWKGVVFTMFEGRLNTYTSNTSMFLLYVITNNDYTNDFLRNL